MTSPAPEPTSSARYPDGDVRTSRAEMASSVELLTNPESAMHAGELPMWNRLAEGGPAGWLSRAAWILTWCAAVAMIAVALLRLIDHDGNTLLIWCNAFTPYFYLPAYPIFAASVWKRRWLLAATSAVAIAFHVTWVAPDFAPAQDYVSVGIKAAPPLRVGYANLRAKNPDFRAVLAEIVAEDPDVIVLAECLPSQLPSMRSAPELRPYIYGTDLNAPYAGDVVVFARVPIIAHRLRYVTGKVVNFVDIPQGNETLRIIALHSQRPLFEVPDRYALYWDELEPLIAREHGPTLVIGDFNATQNSAVHQRLTSGRLRSAHSDHGRGYASTWPNGRTLLPPIRIDHALISPEVECLSIFEGEGRGSDHRPLVLELQVYGPPTGDRR